ncbi:MAG: orotidine-5'-phosphate decarboxylase [Patescibacteria group bacterium]
MNMLLEDRLVLACDVSAIKSSNGLYEAKKLIAIMGGKVGWIKLNSAFIGGGHDLTRQVIERGFRLWLDLKWHDVPDTLKNYTMEGVKGPASADMFNVHASGGFKMMRAVKEKLDELYPHPDSRWARPLVIAITVLTSLDQQQFEQIGFTGTIAEQVMRLAQLTKEAGLDGVVASPLEAKILRQEFGPDFLIVTPGIRFAEEAKDGQARVTTPKEAIANGADMVVMGTSLIKGGLKAVERAYAEIAEGLEERQKM